MDSIPSVCIATWWWSPGYAFPASIRPFVPAHPSCGDRKRRLAYLGHLCPCAPHSPLFSRKPEQRATALVRDRFSSDTLLAADAGSKPAQASRWIVACWLIISGGGIGEYVSLEASESYDDAV
jgi:hypothetical protein